jgi:outer membrane protein OmpA-like peptidoglycan-associated protein
MPQPVRVNGPETEASAGPSADAAGSGEFEELRRLLIGTELSRISALEDRLDDPVKRSAELARVLPGSIKTAKAKALRESLEPVFEKAFENSVRKHPKELADAIYPVMGPAIRKSIAASISEFAETLNQIVEKSVSLRAIQWRVEALVTGKAFSEILLTRSLLYSVEQVFLIHRKSGLLLQHVSSQAAVLKDADMIAGMLTAIQDFFSDSFTESGQDLETLDTGRYKLWIQYGPKALVVGAVSGTAPAELTGVFRNAIDKIHETFYAELDSFKQDDVSVFDGAQPMLQACLLGQSGPQGKRRPWILWGLIALILLTTAGFIWYRAKEQRRWDAYFSSLRRQPGIVITNVEKRGSGYVVQGLKDPLVPEPHENHVSFAWQPYLSLNTTFAAEREFLSAKDQLEGLLVRFDAGSSRLLSLEAWRIDQIAGAIAKVVKMRPASRVVLTGRADEVGNAETNDKLSVERSKNVMEALTAQGIPREWLEVLSVGNTQPLRKGTTDWDRATNRSVSFQVR